MSNSLDIMNTCFYALWDDHKLRVRLDDDLRIDEAWPWAGALSQMRDGLEDS